MRRYPPRRPTESGEFLWLMSLSDLMILLFIFFVVLFSFTYKKMKQSDFQRIVATLRNKQQPPNPIDEIHTKLAKWVSEQKLDQSISVTKNEDGVTVEIKDRVFFESGAFQLNPQSTPIVKSLAQTLEKIPEPFRIGIEGHTDDIPIHTAQIQDNWDLSAKRALSVLESLDLSHRMLRRTYAMAAGEWHPLVPNRDSAGSPIAENQMKNRRVTLRIF